VRLLDAESARPFDHLGQLLLESRKVVQKAIMFHIISGVAKRDEETRREGDKGTKKFRLLVPVLPTLYSLFPTPDSLLMLIDVDIFGVDHVVAGFTRRAAGLLRARARRV